MSILAQNTGTGNTAAIGDVSGTEYRVAQGFQLDYGAVITSVELSFISNYNSPAGQVTCRIETDSSGPSNTLVDVNATKAFTPTESAWNTITFDTSFNVDGSTLYWIVFRCDNQSNNNAWRINIGDEGGYTGGNASRSTDGGSSWADFSYDLTFKLNGTLLIPNKALFFGCNF